MVERSVYTLKKSSKKIKKSFIDEMEMLIIVLVIIIAVLLTIIPFINVIAVSCSSPESIMQNRVFLWPIGFNSAAYMTVFRDSSMLRSMAFTIFLTVVYTFATLFMTVCAAYPLTKKNMFGQKAIMLFVIFTMYFSGGIVPEYILMRQLGITNTMWVLVLPGLISVYNMIIMKSFLEQLPQSIEESALIDGAGYITTLTRIVLPISKPILATLALYYAVARWNTFQDALYYITNEKLYPLQLKLNLLINITQASELTQFENVNLTNLVPENVKSASIVFATVPIVLVYPWLQKYFVTGITLGAVKG